MRTNTHVCNETILTNQSENKRDPLLIFEETLNIINPKHMPFSLFLWGEREGLKKKGGRDLLCSLLLLQTRYKKEDSIGRAITPLSFFFVIGTTTTTTTTHFTRALSCWREEEEEEHTTTTTRPVHYYYYYTLLCVCSITHARTQREEEEEEVFLKEILYLSRRHHHVRRGFRWG